MRKIDQSAFIAPGAQVIGDVTIGSDSGIWYNAVVRGDSREITIGNRTNVQDLAVLHVDKNYQLTVGNNVTIGYFSGSITHNSDIEMIKPALIKILKEYDNVKLLFLGELTLQENFINYTEKIINKKFTDWRQLPKIISNVDINIAPLEDTIFNQAKSENKWVEASLVKVPTIASNIGSFKNSIRHNETGLLCDNINDWYISLKTLINNQELRKYIGENAYNVCK